MRPRGRASKWVKVLPWYYTERRTPARQQELRDAVETDATATGQPTPEATR